MGTPPRSNAHIRTIRSEVTGWSTGATRRNLAFLRTIDERKLNDTGYTARAITLTLRDCPASADDWHRIRKAFLQRLTRLGMIRGHWVTEWQRRGVPHLHGCIWLPDDVTPVMIKRHWLQLTAHKYGASPKAQHVLIITDAVGWFKYLSKHAARGVAHYQRSAANIPEGWKTKTGRVWGHVGDWPLSDPLKIKLDDAGFYRFRRLARSWRVADARSREVSLIRKMIHVNPFAIAFSDSEKYTRSGAAHAVTSAKRALRCSDRSLSNVRGVSEWIPGATTLIFLTWMTSEGYAIALRETPE
jgi:hypothetical protein